MIPFGHKSVSEVKRGRQVIRSGSQFIPTVLDGTEVEALCRETEKTFVHRRIVTEQDKHKLFESTLMCKTFRTVAIRFTSIGISPNYGKWPQNKRYGQENRETSQNHGLVL